MIIHLILLVINFLSELILPKTKTISGGLQEHKKIALIRGKRYNKEQAQKLFPRWKIVTDKTKHADFVYITGLNYNPNHFKTATIGNKLKGLSPFYNKVLLHEAVSEKDPELMMTAINVDENYKYPDGEVKILKAASGWKGLANFVVTNQKEFDEAYEKIKAFNEENYGDKKLKNNIILSDYINPPLLHNGKKFHLRIHLIILLKNDGQTKAYAQSDGTLITALKPYEEGRYNDTNIHDTHAYTNPDIEHFPDDCPEVNPTRVYDCLRRFAKIIIPRVSLYPEMKNAYEVFGVDMMFTADGTPKILELNQYPAYFIYNKTLERLVSSVVPEVFGPISSADKSLVVELI